MAANTYDLNWKSNPIPKLFGKNGEEDIPDLDDFLKFKDIVVRAAGAVGISWIWKVIEYFQTRDDGHCPQFLEMPGIIPMIGHPNQADYDSEGFQTCCCALAMQCGRRFQYNVPSANPMETRINFESLKSQLDSFGLQVSSAARKHRTDVFVSNDVRIATHPFRALLEFTQLELSFDPFKQSAGTKNWEDLIALVGKEVSIDPPSNLTEHMREITIVRNNLTATVTKETLDGATMGTLLRKIHEGTARYCNSHQEVEESAITMFKNKVISWQQEFEEDPNKVPFTALQINLRKEIARLEEKRIRAATEHASKRPRITPMHPPNMALQAFYQLPEAGYMGDAGTTNHEATRFTAQDMIECAMNAFAEGKAASPC